MKFLRPYIIFVLLFLLKGMFSTNQLFAQDSSVWQNYYVREVPDSIVASLQKDKQFAYANDPAYWAIKQEPPVPLNGFLDFLRRPWFRYLIYLVIVILLLLALWAVLKANNMFIFYASARKKRTLDLPAEAILNWDMKIAEALRDHDFRLAIRYHFLQMLHRLHDKSLITWHPETTNAEYLLALRQHPRYHEVQSLTRIYEYAWYGDFEVSESLYRQVAGRFNLLNNRI